MKNITYNELANLKCGDQIVMHPKNANPVVATIMSGVYVYLTKFDTGTYMFKGKNGASLSIRDQLTIDNFGVKLVEETDPEFDVGLSSEAQMFGNFLDQMEKAMSGATP